MLVKIATLTSVVFVLPLTAWCQAAGGGGGTTYPRANLLAISQGISSPSATTGTLVSNNFSRENPVAAAFIQSYRTTLEVDSGSSLGFGADIAVGDGQYGFSVGFRQPGCADDLCDGYARGQMALESNGFGVGLGLSEDLFTLGFLFNGRGRNRVGLLLESNQDSLLGQHQVLGLGYSYVKHGFTAAIDASYINRESGESTLKVSPGVSIRIRDLAVSFNYDAYVQDASDSFGDHGWFGIGYSYEEDLHIAVYANYINDWTLTVSYFF